MPRPSTRALLRVNRWAVIAILASMALMVFANVRAPHRPFDSLVEEVSRYLMIWLTFPARGRPALRRAHRHRHFAGSLSAAGSIPRAVIFVLLPPLFSWPGRTGISLRPADVGADDADQQIPVGAVYRDAGRLRPDDRAYVAHGGALHWQKPSDDEFDADAVKL
jgi:hypothetical protein